MRNAVLLPLKANADSPPSAWHARLVHSFPDLSNVAVYIVDDAPCDLKGLYMGLDVDDRPSMDEMCMSDSQRDYYEFS